MTEQSDATISKCGRYRYWLERRWVSEKRWKSAHAMVFIMLNPSTADATHDDPTIRKCIKFAKREGAGGIVVVNLFALRATDPKTLDDPAVNIMAGNAMGAETDNENTKAIGMALLAATLGEMPVVCAWGSNKHASLMADRIIRRAEYFDATLMCLKVNADGNPKHPLYVRDDAPLIPYP